MSQILIIDMKIIANKWNAFTKTNSSKHLIESKGVAIILSLF